MDDGVEMGVDGHDVGGSPVLPAAGWLCLLATPAPAVQEPVDESPPVLADLHFESAGPRAERRHPRREVGGRGGAFSRRT